MKLSNSTVALQCFIAISPIEYWTLDLHRRSLLDVPGAPMARYSSEQRLKPLFRVSKSNSFATHLNVIASLVNQQSRGRKRAPAYPGPERTVTIDHIPALFPDRLYGWAELQNARGQGGSAMDGCSLQ